MRIENRVENNDDGASLIEFAMILPILAALLLGIVTVGLALNGKNSINNAAREGARYGATLTVDTSMTDWLNDVSDVAIRSATGQLDNGIDARTLCVAYVYPAGTAVLDRTSRVEIDPAGNRTYALGQCFADGRPNDERRVQVSAARDTEILALFFIRGVTLDAESVARFEREQ
ncbi:MAG: pilus assembly protein [Acidimicrobiia bacterium]|nr:pilus assembly protein [Acidimicrobiia bacterium]